MPLQIGVDAWNLLGDRRGIGRYVREIVSRWASRQPQRLRVSLLVPERATWFARRRYLNELGGFALPVRHRSADRVVDVVWYPWNGMSWVASVPSVATLHDASLFSMPPSDPVIREREQRPFRLAALHARRIITVSQFSRDELIRHLHLRPDSVDVIYHGISERFKSDPIAQRPGTQARYLLFVGEPEPRKGLSVLLQAIALLPQTIRDATELVVAGASGQYPVPPAPESVRMRALGWVNDALLADLYAHAAALVYPSQYEGFGLPMIEAMACGTPVIASDIPSHREACADAALYVRPRDPAALADAILAALTQPDLARSLRERGLVRASGLTWEATADKTLLSIEHALEGSPQ